MKSDTEMRLDDMHTHAVTLLEMLKYSSQLSKCDCDTAEFHCKHCFILTQIAFSEKFIQDFENEK